MTSSPSASARAAEQPGTIRVWSATQRLLHLALVACVVGCWWWREGGPWHEALGYVALGVAAARVAGGGLGPRAWRFGTFVRSPRATLAYALAYARGHAARHVTHNPLGGWMVVALLTSAIVAGASGAVYDTDRFWGDPVVWAIHQLSAWAFVLLVPLHVGGVLLGSWLHRENLIAAMLHGRKRAPGPDDAA